MPARSRRGRRTDYTWQGSGVEMTALDISSSSIVTVASANLAATVMRCRGRLMGQLDTGGADERVSIVLGLIVADDDQLAAGVSAFPTPAADADAEWIWVGSLLVSSGAEAAVVEDGLFDRISLDSKAMRRVKQNDNVVLVAETPANGSVDQTGTVDVIGFIRVLFGT